jgi:diguanylate cyclase (GGDEF)-like protein
VPIETLLALVGVLLVANLVLIAVSPGSFGERLRRGARRSAVARPADGPAGSELSADDADRLTSPGDLRPAALYRVIRVATWVFIFAASTVVAVTDLWAARQGEILLVLAVAAITLVVISQIRGRIRETLLLTIEGALGLLLAGLLIAFTGGATSPFAFTLALIVVGAAIVVTPEATLLLTAGAGATYLAAMAFDAQTRSGPPSEIIIATAGINLTALCLIAYVGMAIGREQRRAREDANRQATEDLLTGLRSRPYLFAALDREVDRSQRTGRSFCLLMIDLDDLKSINDGLGHLHGDRALQLVGDVVRTGIRKIDTGARFGGDEFVVLLPETDPTGGWVLAEKIRQGVAEADLAADGVAIPTSVSIGVVTYPQDGQSVRALLECADAAMYRSKRAGRDRVSGVPVMAPEETVTGRTGRPV